MVKFFGGVGKGQLNASVDTDKWLLGFEINVSTLGGTAWQISVYLLCFRIGITL